MSRKFQELGLKDVHGVFQFNISGPQGGRWHAVCSGDRCQVETGAHQNPDVTIDAKDKDVVRLIEKKMSPLMALATRRVKVRGNPLLIAQIRGLLSGRV